MQLKFQRNELIFKKNYVIKKFNSKICFYKELKVRKYIKNWSLLDLIDYDEKEFTITYKRSNLTLFSDYIKGLKNYKIFDNIVTNMLENKKVDDNLFISEKGYDYFFTTTNIPLPKKFIKGLDLEEKFLIHGDFRPYNLFYKEDNVFYVFDWEFSQNSVIEKDLSKFYLESLLLNREFSNYILSYVYKNFNYYNFLFYSIFYGLKYKEANLVSNGEFNRFCSEVFEEISKLI